MKGKWIAQNNLLIYLFKKFEKKNLMKHFSGLSLAYCAAKLLKKMKIQLKMQILVTPLIKNDLYFLSNLFLRFVSYH